MMAPAACPAPASGAQALQAGQPGQVADAPIDSQQLLQGRQEVVILHQGQAYRLQQTRAGKLILVK
ncbi:MAG: Hemin uptake protein hemP [Pseudomonadota bacterium]|jgi:hemin uptake protein HemP